MPAVRWLPRPGHGGYHADPFGWQDRTGRLHILCEDYDAAADRGHLAALGPERDGKAVRLEGMPDCHLSYPFLLADDENLYCIPESWEAGEVRLYRAVEPPGRWQLDAVLLPGIPGVDATVFNHGRRWWLACTRHDRDADRDLYLWHAPALRGPWTPHQRQPVKSDYASTRPAGTPFWHAGALHRPAQDCSATYGGAVVINRVRELTPEAFAEETVVRLTPGKDWPHRGGWHTLSGVGERTTLVDAKRVMCLPPAFRRVLRRKLRRAMGVGSL